MKTICLLLLSCALPFVALSQIQPDKAIIDDYAQPAFARQLSAAEKKFIVEGHVYLVAADPSVFFKPTNEFVVLKQISPAHAVVYINSPSINNAENLFRYMMPASNAWKASPALLNALKTGKPAKLIVSVKDANAYTVQPASIEAVRALLDDDQVIFIDLAARMPKEELLISGFDLGTNNVNTAHYYFPGITGEGLTVAVKENRFDTLDIDLKGRIIQNDITSPTFAGHASIMATMMAGAGNTFYQGQGVAWKANLQSVNFANLMPETDAYYSGQRISVQNHSYGTGIENFYGADAAAYDATVINKPDLLHVFSAGNSGLLPSAGPYAGITGYANLTGSFKMAKNNLVVGAIDSIGNVEAPSSKGPAYDGRIKPELVAFGQDGSSGAAAIVSGISLLLQQAYQQQHSNTLPASALVKAVLINTADDVSAKGLDFASGYGKANAYEALKCMTRSQYFTNSIQQGNTQTFSLNIPAGIRTLKLTLAWADVPAQANAVKALINDLDLELMQVSSGQNFQPWVLSRFPSKDSLQLPAVRGRDTLNNVEQITLDVPAAGDYLVRIKGSRVTASQTYFVAYAADTLNTFEWLYPMPPDPVESGTGVLLRWKSGFTAGTTGQVQFTLDGSNWQTIASNIDVNKNYYRWNAPDTFSTAKLRMNIGSNSYVTDTFVISKLISTSVGFNCADSFMFYWNKPKGVNSFRVYKLGSKYLEPVSVINDTFYISATTNSTHFTIAPLIKGKEGMKAYTFNYTSQGVGCYFKNFLAVLNGSSADLLLQLGTLYHVKKFTVQKLSGNNFADIQTINDPTALQFNLNDAALKQGVNIYRIALQLADGRIIYSSNESVYFLNNKDYLIYPNPVRSVFKIQQKEPVEINVLLYDATGRLVKNEVYADIVNPVNVAGLQKGIYIVMIVKEGRKVFRGKVIVN